MTPTKSRPPISRATPTWPARLSHRFIGSRILKITVSARSCMNSSILINDKFDRRRIFRLSGSLHSKRGRVPSEIQPFRATAVRPRSSLSCDDLLTSPSNDDSMTASYIKSVLSKSFKGKGRTFLHPHLLAQLIWIAVYSSAKCPPPLPSTFLTKHLQEQGIKLRTKKTQNPQ